MRTDIVHIGAGELNYEIRNIIGVVDKLKALGADINLENIGDPVAKGEEVPLWMKEIVSRISMENCAYSYCPSQGILETRQYLAERNNRLRGATINPDDIIFFNGLGDAITKVYGLLRRTARVITPSPTYTTHSSSEAAHAGVPPVTYPLDPHNHWYPDTVELRKRVKYNPAVAGILLINPDNPTGAVYPEEVLREIVAIAEEYDLFIIADEIYENLVFNGSRTRTLSQVIGRVPGMAMKGISKELPWPGSRCGWIELYNRERDPDFKTYAQSILNAKMVEVCSTTLPQKVIPLIFEHPEYDTYIQKRRTRYKRLSDIAHNRLEGISSILLNRTSGAFYMSVLFKEGALSTGQTLKIANGDIRSLIERLVSKAGISLDKRFVYYLLAATGVCVVPLSSFNTDLQGFRFTLLDPDEASFTRMVKTLAQGIEAYR
ncbi:MAG: pyridoxal phosphate-dependent aminotransferase [Deltaproteobacteria bacterium]|nr:pyridoxal phosphate-dependent aminotransferase [Deltaproteobacteria bacterium]